MMGFGRAVFQHENARLNQAARDRGTLIAVHRGTARGAIIENTSAAVTAAIRSGGDLVEIDAAKSCDGQFFVFHDGLEYDAFGVGENLRSLDSERIRELRYRADETGQARVETLNDILIAHPNTLLNIDRSWRDWPELFHLLGARTSVLLKVEAHEADPQEVAREWPVKFPLLPIVRSASSVDRWLDDPQINVVGVEVVADRPNHELLQPDFISYLKERDVLVYMNAIDLGNGRPLCAGWDDTVAVTSDPDLSWGRLLERGANVIQTDWPSLLERYLCDMGVRTIGL